MKNILTCLLALFVLVSCGKKGCMDPLAQNYSSTAKKDDNSCIYSISNSWNMSSYKINGIDLSSNFNHFKLICYADSSFWRQSIVINDSLTKDTNVIYTNIYIPDTTISQLDSTYVLDTIYTAVDTTIIDTTITIIDTLIFDSLVTLIDTSIVDTLIYDSTTFDIIGNYNLSNMQTELDMQYQNIKTNSNFDSGNDWQLDNSSFKFSINVLTDSIMHLILISSSDPNINSMELIYNKE